MASEAEIRAMRQAIGLAARGLATALPNPVVGCVLLDPDGTVVAQGWHERAGGPHAEVVALRAAGERARGTTAVVTLEPCNHTGRTGPCSEALLAAGVQKVVIAVPDPSDAAAGGAERLRRAGLEVEVGVLADEAERGLEPGEGNEVWLTAVRKQRPFVTWKFAATLDGRVAAQDGTSQWITSVEARSDVHRLRAQVDTMLVGVGTVLADDPLLTVRDAEGNPLERQPLRVVADTHNRTPANARIRGDDAPTWIATGEEVGTSVGTDADAAGDGGGRLGLDLHALMRALYARERRHVLLEGGPRMAGAMVEAGLVDRVVAYLAPALLGAGPNAMLDAGITTIADVWRLDLVDVRQVGNDVRVLARPRTR
ncbi:bifunctional diaminohydroxyphosphoribosylaminopyrimidine deaminase/5-amino-6-(5-phosphoribosylamino)uracil reductase RibD [Kineosporia rhizophila]|uniref:bifunctional diaminohydroxyphosphoribosylaminopyrimidine deaminase/5-amino-6-(5-phosphoribosylamino)uracil reductase RibD n=1 Tax=Kineosporia rhizophila TaxID=84633 RepID=UPI001E65D6F7|nr:bifunctional diaminohydroxyphosphoribosylaminopyrimidine deaminase/5-amino-6-(5-phosphoribosylamino)uracil reductase RibD [Kineosporia rhizophila]MCE0539223.1 bifunctional diaminohydroxyphosphoribosylaminopyrimidine deaminase/5-amino-6-(5-phosphoribosylamino)uracil reductase RibD [Kineosporia rhizophila]